MKLRRTPNHRPWAQLLGCVLLACSGTESSPGLNAPSPGEHPDTGYSAEASLQQIDAQVRATLEQFRNDATELREAARTFALDPNTGDRAPVQIAWRAAMATWQRAELFRFGPAADVSLPDGTGLADQVYSWVVSTNACRVDQETSAASYSQLENVREQAINVRGLDALEYLIFNDSEDNRCLPNAAINSSGEWDDLGDGLPLRRAAHAAILADDLEQSAEELLEAWDNTGGLADSESFDTPLDATAAVVGAMLYLDTATKDRKVGVPAGLVNCAAETCPEDVESKFAGVSRENIRGNLEGLQLLLGTEGYGISDQLIDVGASQLATDLDNATQAALDAVDDLGEVTLRDALESDLDGVVGVYDSIKALTDRIKGELIDELGVSVTQAGAGDAD